MLLFVFFFLHEHFSKMQRETAVGQEDSTLPFQMELADVSTKEMFLNFSHTFLPFIILSVNTQSLAFIIVPY